MTDGILNQCAEQMEGFIFWICFAVVSIVSGIPAAVALIWETFQRWKKGTSLTPHDVFMTNISLMDAIFLFLLIPDLFTVTVGYNSVYSILLSFFFSLTLCGRPLLLVCISLDCYLAVVHPIIYRTRKSLTPRVLMAVGIWIITAAHGCYLVITFIKFSMASHEAVFYAVTLPVIGFCNLSVLWTLKRSTPGGRDIHTQKKKALQIISNNLVVTFLSYFPILVAWVVPRFMNLDDKTVWCLVTIPVTSTTLLGNTVSPILQLNNLGKLDWLKCWKRE